MDTFFRIIETYQFEDPRIIHISRITRILHDIANLPSYHSRLGHHENYSFRERAQKLAQDWDVLVEKTAKPSRWIMMDDYLTLRMLPMENL
ncbi:hypothetical protein BDZ97DRAFT_1804808 [Flammula alnicola]|nr:hypothetical protein BDZ97DRAFT_1804808 [Flammula alnicola]